MTAAVASAGLASPSEPGRGRKALAPIASTSWGEKNEMERSGFTEGNAGKSQTARGGFDGEGGRRSGAAQCSGVCVEANGRVHAQRQREKALRSATHGRRLGGTGGCTGCHGPDVPCEDWGMPTCLHVYH